MSIFSSLKRLVFGEQKAKFSQREFQAGQQQAEAILQKFNESFKLAKKSENNDLRQREIRIARQLLSELKELTTNFTFLRLENLQAVEADVIAVEAEIYQLSTKDVVGVQLEVRQHGTGKMETEVMQGFFRVISESIAIARKSKNIGIKVSRLNVARNALQEARKQANQLALDVAGFDEAENEIIRIEMAIEAGTPTEIPGMVDMDEEAAYSSVARDLLKEATELKRAKKYNEACDKLRDAYSADGSENLLIEERLRLPMYLQLAGRGDEGWDKLNQLSAKYTDQFSRPRCSGQTIPDTFLNTNS